jgi:hypothetical protein
MHIPIRSERQRRRALRILLAIEAEHVAQCKCPESCKMLRELREEIACLGGQLNPRWAEIGSVRRQEESSDDPQDKGGRGEVGKKNPT